MNTLPKLLLLVAVMSLQDVKSSMAEDTSALQTQADQQADIREPPGVVDPPRGDLPPAYFWGSVKVTLPCHSDGYPKPQYTWFKDDQKLHFDDVTWTGNKGSISIARATYRDEGSYQCVAENTWGKSLSQVFTLREAKSGSFPGDKDVEPFTGTLGNWLTIKRLPIASVPEATFRWNIINDVEDTNARRLTYTKRMLQDIEGNLYFTSLRREDSLSDSKFYKVVAKNTEMDRDTGGSYSRVLIDNKPPVSPPATLIYPTKKSTKKVVLEGDKIILNCIFGGIQHEQDIISWSPSDAGEISDYGTRLTIVKATLADKRDYTCTGKNSKGEDTATITVDVQTIPKFTVNGRPQRQRLSEGDTARFTCQVTEDTYPKATISWMFNTESINEKEPGARTEVHTFENGKNLTITNLNRDVDIKVIQCNVSNEHKTIYIDAPLNVLLRTVQTVSPEDDVISSNYTFVNLTCSGTTDPSTKLKISWTRDGRPISYYKEDSNIVVEEGALVLNLSRVHPGRLHEYGGIYGCNASNGYSHDFQVAKLTYVGDSPGPSEFPKIDEAYVKSILWLIILFIVIGLLIVIFFLVCCGCCIRNKGGSYNVDDKERATGNDPVADEKTDGFHDYVRPPVAKRKDSRASLTSTVFMGSTCSLNFGNMSERGMSEDGSFIGLYAYDNRRKLDGYN